MVESALIAVRISWIFFLVSHVRERPWWPIQTPTKEERREQKAKRRERSDQVY